jgi:hypothetical protein
MAHREKFETIRKVLADTAYKKWGRRKGGPEQRSIEFYWADDLPLFSCCTAASDFAT